MIAHTSSGGSHFFALPSTKLGRVSAWLFLVALVVFVAQLFFPRGTQIRVGPGAPIASVMTLGFVGAFVTGVVALIGYHERSWAVWVASLLPALVIAADVAAGLLGGG